MAHMAQSRTFRWRNANRVALARFRHGARLLRERSGEPLDGRRTGQPPGLHAGWAGGAVLVAANKDPTAFRAGVALMPWSSAPRNVPELGVLLDVVKGQPV
jgi:hypothetical protein